MNLVKRAGVELLKITTPLSGTSIRLKPSEPGEPFVPLAGLNTLFSPLSIGSEHTGVGVVGTVLGVVPEMLYYTAQHVTDLHVELSNVSQICKHKLLGLTLTD